MFKLLWTKILVLMMAYSLYRLGEISDEPDESGELAEAVLNGLVIGMMSELGIKEEEEKL